VAIIYIRKKKFCTMVFRKSINCKKTGLFFFFYCIYAYICRYCTSDMIEHVRIALNHLEEGHVFSGNFLFYFLVNLFSGFTGIRWLAKIVLCGLLAWASTYKFSILKKQMDPFVVSSNVSSLLSLSLCFVFVIPILSFCYVPYYYLGYEVPNVWHNSTIIFLFPFAFLLFFCSLKQLKEGVDNKRNLGLLILILLNVYTKPSFFFVFACSYPFMLFIQYKTTRNFWKGIFPVLIGFVFLYMEYNSIYERPLDGSSVCLDFKGLLNFSFWSEKMSYLIVSLFLPIVYLLFYLKKTIRDREFLYILLLLFSALGIFFICKELGSRANHGNFYWQVVPVMALLFYYVLKSLVVDIKKCGYNKKNVTVVSIYILHVISGLFYLSHYLIVRNYY